MKNLFICTFICLLSSFLDAQNFANDWIQSGQTYVKLEVSEPGIYRVSLSDLSNAGYDLSQIDPQFLHIYHRGVEQPIYVKADSGRTFNYLEFYGEALDGADDVSLYREAVNGSRNINTQTHPQLSLFSDKSACFLTWDQSPSGLRIVEHRDTSYQSFTPVPYFRYKSQVEFNPSNPATEFVKGAGELYDPFYQLNPSYGIGEGFVGPGIFVGSPRSIDIPTQLAANTSWAECNLRVLGTSQSAYHVKAELNGNQASPVIDNSRTGSVPFLESFSRTLNLSQQLPQSSQLNVFSLTHNSAIIHPVEASIIYDRLPDLNGESEIRISRWPSVSDAYFRFSQADGNNTVYVYDLENGVRNIGRLQSGVAQVVVKGFSNETDLYVATDKGILQPQIVSNHLNDLSQFMGAQLLIITHRSLESSAQAYASYRDTNQVNSLSSRIVYTDEIYDEFGYGSPTPLAIQRFCRFAIENWQNPPEYVLLWGKGADLIRDRSRNLVPTYGYPASDHYFVVPLLADTRDDLIPEIPIGRLNIENNQAGINYLNKVISYEHALDISWLNQGMFLGGGRTLGEQRAIESALAFTQNVFDTSSPLKESFLCLNAIRPTDTLCYPSIDQGVGLIHYFGHTSGAVQDIALEEAVEYSNFGKFPLLIGMGNEGGDFTQITSFGERWVLEENRGAIAFVGNASFAYLNPLRDLGKILYPNLYISGDQRLGDAIHTSITQYLDSLVGVQYVNHALQFNLQGDPTLLWRGSQTLTGIDPHQPSIDFKLYPNPAHSQFVLSYELPKRGRVELRILDVQGRIIDRFQDKMGAGFHEFDWTRPEGMSRGIYFVQIMYEGFVYSEKLIVRD